MDKCSLCYHRITRGLTTACCETCPTGARVLADLKNPADPIHEFLRAHKVQVLKPQMANSTRLRKVLNERIRSAVRGAKLRAAFNSTYSTVGGLGSLAVLVLGGVFVIRGKLTIGEFVAFNAYVDMLVWPMIGIADMITWIWQTGVEERRVRELAEFTPDVRTDTGARPAGDFQELRMTKVGFSYAPVAAPEPDTVRPSPSSSQTAAEPTHGPLRPALEDIDIVLTPGARIGIAGTVGSGKSTIMRLLVRAAEPSKARLLRQKQKVFTVQSAGIEHRIRLLSSSKPVWETKSDADHATRQKPNPSDSTDNDVGYYFDLNSRERVISDVMIRDGNLLAIGFTPNKDPCGPGGNSIFMELNAFTGGTAGGALFDISGDRAITAKDLVRVDVDEDGISEELAPSGIEFMGNLQPPSILQIGTNPKNPLEKKYMSSSTGLIEQLTEKGPKLGVTYWMEVHY